VVRHGINGLLAAEGDSQALGSNLLQLLREDAVWAKHSEAGLAWVRERFDITRQTVELERIYTQVLEDR
jgi:glycosyltransferase involved in cell wall biosynthesis